MFRRLLGRGTRRDDDGDQVERAFESITTSLEAIKLATMAAMPEVSELRESQREPIEKEQRLIHQLQQNLEQEQQAKMKGVRAQLPFDPENIKKESLDHLEYLKSQQEHVQNSMEVLQGNQEYPFFQQRNREILEYLQQLQPQLAERRATLRKNLQAQRQSQTGNGNRHTNVALPGSSATDHVHPHHYQAGSQDPKSLAHDASDGLTFQNQWGTGRHDEELDYNGQGSRHSAPQRHPYMNIPPPSTLTIDNPPQNYHQATIQGAYDLLYHGGLAGHHQQRADLCEEEIDYEEQLIRHYDPHRNAYTNIPPASTFTIENPPPDYHQGTLQGTPNMAYEYGFAGQHQQGVETFEEELDDEEEPDLPEEGGWVHMHPGEGGGRQGWP